MAKYSQVETPEFVQRMDDWLKAVSALFRERLADSYQATLLMGGYGRGWGALVETPEGPMPVNDLDIAVVTEARLPAEELFSLHKLATEVVNSSSRYDMLASSPMDVHADVMNFSLAEIKTLPPSQYHLDFVRAATLVDGEDVLADSQDIAPASLDASEALKLIFNHATNIWEPWAVGDVHDEDTKAAAFFTATKAAIAAACSLVMLEGRYSPFHEERFSVLQEMWQQGRPEQLSREQPDFPQKFDELARQRSLLTDEKRGRAWQTYCTANTMLAGAAENAASVAFGCNLVFDEFCRKLPDLWSTSSLARQPASPKTIAKAALTVVGLRPKPAPWRPTALIYAAGGLLMSALSFTDGEPVVSQEATAKAVSLLTEAGISTEQADDPLVAWQLAGQAAVSALKRQNWVR